METLSKKKISEMLRLHDLWVEGKDGGMRACFSGKNLENADMYDAYLREAYFADARMRKAYLMSAYLRCADFTNADMQDASLQMADMSFSNMTDANLENADCFKAVMSNACMRNANLRNATLIDADLRDSCLYGADLRGAKLGGAIMSGCDLTNARLEGATLGFDTFFGSAVGVPLYQAACGFGSRNGALTLLAIGERKKWRWFTGCFNGTESELRKAVLQKYGIGLHAQGYTLAIDYLVAQATLNAQKGNDNGHNG